jgi:hypothetical protein
MKVAPAAPEWRAGGAGLSPSAAHEAALQSGERKEGAHGGTMGSPVIGSPVLGGDRVTLGTTERVFRVEGT